jgi:hypothetical protein
MRPKSGKRYLIRQKRCNVCQIFINWKNFWCPCCGYRLRSGPSSTKSKLILEEKSKNVRI